jgi:hypothetical protein
MRERRCARAVSRTSRVPAADLYPSVGEDAARCLRDAYSSSNGERRSGAMVRMTCV